MELAYWIYLFLVLLGTPNFQQRGLATTFYPKEKWNNGKFACGGNWTDPSLPVCAHRTLPCRTWVLVENEKTGDTAWCEIRDRGPYGALMPDGTWVVRKPRDHRFRQARYRSIIDLGPTVALRVNTRGKARVVIRAWRSLLRRKRVVQRPMKTQSYVYAVQQIWLRSGFSNRDTKSSMSKI